MRPSVVAGKASPAEASVCSSRSAASCSRAVQPAPGAPYKTFRHMDVPQIEREITRADQTFDQVLAIDPKNVRALTWKAAIRIEHNRSSEGDDRYRHHHGSDDQRRARPRA